MGKFIGFTSELEEDKTMNFVTALQDVKFRDRDNAFIKKNRVRLSDIAAMLAPDKDATEANAMLRKLYEDNGYDSDGKDNEFCYALGDKINAYVGLAPLNNYEE